MPNHLEAVVGILDEIVDVTLVWPGGLKHPGGPHRRLFGMLSPISIGEDECIVFGRVIKAFRPEHCFVIGNAFGLSSVYIASLMREHGGRSVVTLDNQTEGEGKRCAAVAKKLADSLGLTNLKQKKGSSPQDIPGAVEAPVHQLIFVDGNHAHPQVTRDFEGMLPYSDNETIVVWHDFWVPGVSRCVEAARSRGWRCLWIATSCEMVLGTRDPETFEKLQVLFPNGEENRPHGSNLLYHWTVGLLLLRFMLERVVPGLAKDILS